MPDNDDLSKPIQKNNPIRGVYSGGMMLNCRVLATTEPQGYLVAVGQHEDPGLLPTKLELKIGSWVEAEFVCVANGQVLLWKR